MSFKTDFRLDKNILGRQVDSTVQKRHRAYVMGRYPKTEGLPKPEGDVVCMKCGRNDQTFPSLDAIICPRCLVALIKRSVTRVQDDLYLKNDAPNCYMCGQRSVRMYKVSGRICQHCTVTIAENVREHVKHIRRRFHFK